MPPTVPRAEELSAAPAWRTVDFLSDLHLDPGHEATVQALAGYLARTHADAIFLLGDLFEVWVGDDALADPGSFESRCCALLAQAARQHALYFLHGNRDFLIGEGFARASGAALLPDPTVLAFAGQRWLLSHGDALCLDDAEYQRFRVLARSPAWQQSFLAVPLAQRRAQARGMRAQSEARKHSSAWYADVDHPAALAWLQAANARALIHGHTHRPATHVLAPGLLRHVLSDWDLDATPPRAEVLRLTAEGLERLPLAPR
ncbi:MAG: UDP-2,3-diacylglucosamine diphosphatase [Comamonadaceae bacterium SCN 68-20]|nr:MAG: UDP-2,3-diacylglucosamine diphosphatase [Comamonadaceae bacterium SCN 68-20]